MLSRLYVMLRPAAAHQTITGISDNYYVIMAMVNVFLIIIGMLMDDFSGTLLSAPLLLPLMSTSASAPTTSPPSWGRTSAWGTSRLPVRRSFIWADGWPIAL